MCGIAGIFQTSGNALPPSAKTAVKAICDSMRHRGPDGEGLWLNGPICLGHRRLSIIDLCGGAQPMSNIAGTLQTVFNGEIYNFRELRAELAKSGLQFRTESDTEVLLAAYERYGTGCLEYLEGMFSFALWDAGRRRLFCARDRFGKKPFFYTLQKGLFCFASELRALNILAKRRNDWDDIPAPDFSLDPSALCRYLAYEYAPCPQSMFKEVRQLAPAHYLLVENGAIKSQRYWDLPTPASSLAELGQSETELAEELESLLSAAVARRMISDVPLGVFLSGGIDSSIVAGLMARHSPRPIKAFSIGFTEASYDESRYARVVAKAFGAEHHERILDASECAEELPKIVSAMDLPMADASCAPTWLLSRLTREHVTVALGGDGADELWAGYEHYIGYQIALYFNRLPQWLRSSLIPWLAHKLPSPANYINPRLAVETFLRGVSAPDWLRVQTMLTALNLEDQRNILAQDWLAAQNLESFLETESLFEPTKVQFEHWQPENIASPLARAFHVYVRQFMLDDILVKVDRCSMLHSLEVRAPFLDRSVAEFAARLPINCKLRGFKRKYLLKKAFAKLLPEQILQRNKRGFQIPVAQWLRGKMRPLMEDLLSESSLARQGIFNPKAIRKMLDAHISGSQDLRKGLWTLIVLQLWLRANCPDTA